MKENDKQSKANKASFVPWKTQQKHRTSTSKSTLNFSTETQKFFRCYTNKANVWVKKNLFEIELKRKKQKNGHLNERKKLNKEKSRNLTKKKETKNKKKFKKLLHCIKLDRTPSSCFCSRVSVVFFCRFVFGFFFCYFSAARKTLKPRDNNLR